MVSQNKLVVGLVALLAFGCDPLTLPAAPDAGTTSNGEGGTTTPTGSIPAGAIVAKGTFAGDSGFDSWITLDGSGNIATLSWATPVATVKKAGAAQIFGYLALPQQVVDKTPFKTLSLQYLPTGHIPAGVYDVPHWEWHLNVVDQAHVDGIDCSDPVIPPKDKLPPNTLCLPTCLPKLGMHGLPLSYPEFNGARFQHGVYAGYYHGDFLAVEPKILTSTLLSQPSFPMPSYDPTPLGPPGQYPKTWQVSYAPDTDSVVISVTEWFTKS